MQKVAPTTTCKNYCRTSLETVYHLIATRTIATWNTYKNNYRAYEKKKLLLYLIDDVSTIFLVYF
jgi:hypothetical protein